ncbi:MAG: ribokinase [Bacteroidales bacterium]|nr:ribokinase [Bacteroidales bacterium]
MSQITVIGSSNIDLIMKIKTLPVKGETVSGGEFMQTFGGKGANQAVGAARAGGKVTFISCVGDDHYGKQCIENFRKDGIDTSHIFVEKNIATGTALIMIGEGGDNMITVASGANFKMTPRHIDSVSDVIRKSEYVLLQYEIPQPTLYYIIEKCNEYGVKVLFNLAPAGEFDKKHISMIHTLIVNEVEAEFLAEHPVKNEDGIKTAAGILLEMGPQNVVITLGAGGSYVAAGNYREKIPSYTVDALDTTAAGDVYCGSLAVAMNEGQLLHKAVGFASAASAISVTRMGAQPSAPHRKEIEELIRKED